MDDDKELSPETLRVMGLVASQVVGPEAQAGLLSARTNILEVSCKACKSRRYGVKGDLLRAGDVLRFFASHGQHFALVVRVETEDGAQETRELDRRTCAGMQAMAVGLVNPFGAILEMARDYLEEPKKKG